MLITPIMGLAFDSGGVVTARDFVVSGSVVVLTMVLIAASFYLGRAVQKRRDRPVDPWSRRDFIGLLRLIVALIAIVLALFNREFRNLLGF
jgi:hypothetical protein